MQFLLEGVDGVLVAALQGEQIIICGLFRFILGGRQVILGFLQSCVCVKAFLSNLVEILLRGFHGGVLCGLLGGFLFRHRGLAAALLLYRLLDRLLFRLGGRRRSFTGSFQFDSDGSSVIKNLALFFCQLIIFRFEPVNFLLACTAFLGVKVITVSLVSGVKVVPKLLCEVVHLLLQLGDLFGGCQRSFAGRFQFVSDGSSVIKNLALFFCQFIIFRFEPVNFLLACTAFLGVKVITVSLISGVKVVPKLLCEVVHFLLQLGNLFGGRQRGFASRFHLSIGGVGFLVGSSQLGFGGTVFRENAILLFLQCIIFRFEPVNFLLACAAFVGFLVITSGLNTVSVGFQILLFEVADFLGFHEGAVFRENAVLLFLQCIIFRFEPVNFLLACAAFFGVLVITSGLNTVFVGFQILLLEVVRFLFQLHRIP